MLSISWIQKYLFLPSANRVLYKTCLWIYLL